MKTSAHSLKLPLLATLLTGCSAEPLGIRSGTEQRLVQPLFAIQSTGPGITTLAFASDATWQVFDADPAGAGPANSLGFAQKVCLNAFTPSPCPPDATSYDSPFFGAWGADLSSIPEAHWIWAPGITGATALADLNEFFFSKTFRLSGPSPGGTLSVAVDDFAEIRVNGIVVGTYGSITDISLAGAAEGSLKTFDLTPFLVTGSNIVTIHAQNGPQFFAGCAEPCRYAQNPAGVVFGGSLRFESVAVGIDIKPGSDVSPINPGSYGKIPVAILSTPTFNAPEQVDRTSLTFGRSGSETSLAFCSQGGEDVNGDGRLDLLCHFYTQQTGFQPDDTEGILKGQTVEAIPVEGRDAVRVMGEDRQL